MRYLVELDNGGYRLINDREGMLKLYYKEILLKEGQGNIDFTLESKFVNPCITLKWDDGLIETAGVQHLTSLGIVNFRDIGGYSNDEGKQIKFRHFYRSAPITSTGDDLTRLKTLQLKSIFDLRSHWEVKQERDIELEGCEYYHYSAMKAMDDFVDHKTGSLNIKDLEEDFSLQDPMEMMKRLYKDLVFANKAYQEMFQLLLNHKTAMVFHCSAGKDRTGIAAALIMLALGVSREDVIHEYLLTNIYRRELIEQMALEKDMSIDEATALQGVKEEYIQLVFDMIDEKYDTLAEYFEKELLVNQDQLNELRTMYTY